MKKTSGLFISFIVIIYLALITACARKQASCEHKNYLVKDSVIFIIDTVYVHHYVDTVYQSRESSNNNSDGEPEKHLKAQKGILQLNPNNLGIGPSFGAYYSPFNGFDLLFGFGIQYFFTRIPFGKTKTRHPGFHKNVHHHK